MVMMGITMSAARISGCGNGTGGGDTIPCTTVTSKPKFGWCAIVSFSVCVDRFEDGQTGKLSAWWDLGGNQKSVCTG